jgi:MoxR-like ATPase
MDPKTEITSAAAGLLNGGETSTSSDVAILERFKNAHEVILREIRKEIVGQDSVVEQVLTSLFVGGNSIITGVPGLAKTLLIRTLASALDLKFKRIQFTPDLMPADITGTDIIEEDHTTGHRTLVFVKGPIFTNILLADEINRTPPKTQSALLEAMQEHSVTVQGTTYPLEPPFFVLATQNPIELEGTYPLPEAQLDRFMFNIVIDYLSEDEEIQVVNTTTSNRQSHFEPVIGGRDILDFQKVVRKIPAAESVVRYAVNLVRASRPGDSSAPDFVKAWVNYGASLRASQFLILGGKARAVMQGRYNVSVDDVRHLAFPVLRHRILTNFHAESEQVDSNNIIQKLIETVPAPKSGVKA